MTYNQVAYIGQCLQSIIDQITNFDFDIIVGDDGSTDGTTDIVRDFSIRFPGKVKPVLHKKNIGPAQNYFSVHNIATGNYIAHVDGDDYCLPGKLQAQADLLDKDPSCNIVWHKMLVEISGVTYEGSIQLLSNIEELRLDRGLLIQYMSIAGHSSKMYRKEVRDFDLPDFDALDYFINVEQVRDGFGRIAGSTYYGVYRMGVGMASSGTKTREILAKSFTYFYKKYPQHRLEVNTAALVCLLADIKNRRETWKIYFFTWINTFHIGSIFNLMRNLKFLKSTTLAKKLIKVNPSAPVI